MKIRQKMRLHRELEAIGDPDLTRARTLEDFRYLSALRKRRDKICDLLGLNAAAITQPEWRPEDA